MFSTNTLTLLLMATASSIIKPAYSNPILDTPKDFDSRTSFEELSDLNKETTNGETIKQFMKSNTEVLSPFMHRDEGQPPEDTFLNNGQSLKYDVEILEADSDIKKENIEIEERFKGPAIELDTDIFIAENIEVHGGDNIHQSHMILTVILVFVALASIGLYAALVIWRSHLDQRYGMRELLVNDDDYCQQNQNYNNSTDGTVNNARHVSFMQL